MILTVEISEQDVRQIEFLIQNEAIRIFGEDAEAPDVEDIAEMFLKDVAQTATDPGSWISVCVRMFFHAHGVDLRVPPRLGH
jgi:hypothetical protein